jgi:hypothetical protein
MLYARLCRDLRSHPPEVVAFDLARREYLPLFQEDYREWFRYPKPNGHWLLLVKKGGDLDREMQRDQEVSAKLMETLYTMDP